MRIADSLSQDMVLTDTDALAARKELADRLKQREYQMAVDADMEAESKSHGAGVVSTFSTNKIQQAVCCS